MEPHRSPASAFEGGVTDATEVAVDAAEPRRTRRRRDEEPLDAAWLEREALRYVARWESSRRGVEAVLERKLFERCERTGEDPESVRALISSVVEGLAERRYVDDRRYARQLLERARKQGRSRARLCAQLAAKGISNDLIEELLDEAEASEAEAGSNPEVAAAWRLARKRRLGPYCRDTDTRRELRERHLGVFARQGFELDVALEVLDAAEPPEDD